jgi:hypothetical protein
MEQWPWLFYTPPPDDGPHLTHVTEAEALQVLLPELERWREMDRLERRARTLARWNMTPYSWDRAHYRTLEAMDADSPHE